MVYASDAFAYDFKAALGPTKRRRFTYGLGKPVKDTSKPAEWPKITLESLQRHVKRYGTDGVREVARVLSDSELLELGFGGSTEERVLALHEQGYVLDEITKRLNLGRPTVRRILGTPLKTTDGVA